MFITEITSPDPGVKQDVNTGFPADTQNSRKYEKFAEMLRTNCGEALAYMDAVNRFLYRGTHTNSTTPDIFLSRPREKRVPLDSDENLTSIYDSFLSFRGFKALRSNSLFCTTRASTAAEYGDNVYYIYPVDGFDFTWSMATDDNLLSKHMVVNYFNKEKTEEYKNKYLTPENVNLIISFIRKTGYNEHQPMMFGEKFINALAGNSNLTTVFTAYTYYNSLKEILINMKKANALGPIPTDAIDDLSYTNLITPESMLDSMKLNNNDFGGALKSGHEIMIHGPYYAINSAWSGSDEINKLLGINAVPIGGYPPGHPELW